jgi:hypothetical protein
MAGCSGHGGSHKGAKKAKPKQSAKKACSVQLKREKKNLKAANKYLKKIFGKK